MRIRDHMRQLLSESAVYGLPSVASRLISVFLVPFYTRVFLPADYGVMALVYATMNLMMPLAVLGLDSAAFRWFYDTESEDDRHKTIASYVWCQIVCATALGILVCAASPWLARMLTDRTDTASLFALAALVLPLTTLNLFTYNFFRMQRRPWRAVIFAIASNLLKVLLTIVLVLYMKLGLLGVYIASGISDTVSGLAVFALIRNWMRPSLFSRQRLVEMLKYSLPLVPTPLAMWIVMTSDRYFLQHFQDNSEVGLYQIGIALAGAVEIVVSAFQNAWAAFAFSILHQPQAKQVYATALELFLVVAGLATLGIALFAPEILSILTPKSYHGAATVVGVNALGYVMMGLYQIVGIGSAIAKRTAPLGIAVWIAAGVKLLASFLLIPRFGRMGAGVSTLLALSAIPAYLYVFSQRAYRIPYRPWVAVLILGVVFVLLVLGNETSTVPVVHRWLYKLSLLTGYGIVVMLLLKPVRLQLLSLLRRGRIAEAGGR